MTVTAASFRVGFPAFASVATYPDPLIDFWLSQSSSFVREEMWRESTDLGTMLVLAHHLVLAARDQKVSQFGGVPGMAAGPLTSKSVDKASSSYDAKLTTELNAGHWGLTTYGLQYVRMARQLGAAPLQVDQATGGGSLQGVSAHPWYGPWFG